MSLPPIPALFQYLNGQTVINTCLSSEEWFRYCLKNGNVIFQQNPGLKSQLEELLMRYISDEGRGRPSLSQIRLILDLGINPNFMIADETPLYRAVESRLPHVVEFLLKAGADVNQPSTSLVSIHPKPPLTKAVINNDPGMVDLLLRYGADVNQKSYTRLIGKNTEETPLYFAVIRGYFPIVQQLVNAGAEITPGELDAAVNHPNILSYLNGLSTETPQMRKIRNDVYTAIQLGQVNNLQRLVKSGISLNSHSIFKESPLSFAIRVNPDVAPFILWNSDNDPNFVNDDGTTPLIMAIRYHNLIIAGDLLSFGANPNQPDAEGKTPLQIAQSIGDPDMISLLIENGAK